MGEQNSPESATESDAKNDQQQQQHDEGEQQQKPTETVEFWKQKAREQEKRAKDNAAAAKKLTELEDAQKTESEKAADRIAKAEAEAAAVPSKVADALRDHLVELHGIDSDDAELFLTGDNPELLLKQVTRLLGQADKRKMQGNHVPREGTSNQQPPVDDEREAVRGLFGGG